MAIGEVVDKKRDQHQVVFVHDEAYEAPINSKAAIFSLVVKRNKYRQFNNWPAILRLNLPGIFTP